ncbi:hypothetical protein AAFF_G00081040 [Aldrovandia affinis]|uniref:Uncharacterized protein n=1 Tax=Aldrovandia affinis TaxID=143900 RepID=A0AAD7T3A4_9TELE|nr:hypothetical protein AAFF_G00081040 [Aldrovandia affinis]
MSESYCSACGGRDPLAFFREVETQSKHPRRKRQAGGSEREGPAGCEHAARRERELERVPTQRKPNRGLLDERQAQERVGSRWSAPLCWGRRRDPNGSQMPSCLLVGSGFCAHRE